MARQDDKIISEGIIDSYAKSLFHIRIDGTENMVVCSPAGRLKKNRIRLAVGDRVKVEISAYDSKKGFIVYRLDKKG